MIQRVQGTDRRYLGVKKTASVFTGLLLFIPSFEAYPCTLFGAIGNPVQGGGALIAKTRDLPKDLKQVWVEIFPERGYRYRGITSKGTKRITSGINEKGLVVVSAAAPSNVERRGKITAVGEILSKASSVDEVLALVQGGEIQGPVYYLIGDSHKLALLEVIDGYRFGYLIQENGVLSHTNHFILKEMKTMNRKVGTSSRTRLDRIEKLLSEGFLTKDRFVAFVRDHLNGPGNNSICRHFEAGVRGSERTVSAAIYYLPKEAVPEIWVGLGPPCQVVFERK